MKVVLEKMQYLLEIAGKIAGKICWKDLLEKKNGDGIESRFGNGLESGNTGVQNLEFKRTGGWISMSSTL